MTLTDRRLALIDALIYGEAFRCAATTTELWRYCRVAIERDELRLAVAGDASLRRLVGSRGDLLCIAGSEWTLERRAERRARALRLQRRARAIARLLRHVPFVRGLLVSGSTAADDAPRGADLDLVVVVDGARLGYVFLMLGSVSSLTRRRLFCPNLYVATAALRIEPRTPYTAREIAQALPLAGDPAALWEANRWVAEWFPNAYGLREIGPTLASGSLLQRALEHLLLAAGPAPEQFARRLAERRLRTHYAAVGEEVPPERLLELRAGRRLGFHRGRWQARIDERYGAVRATLARRLDESDDHQAIA